MDFVDTYLIEAKNIIDSLILESKNINKIIEDLITLRDYNRGRVFIIGIGGSAANASHMVNDLRKLCGIEAYTPTDNVSEFSARTNDDGFDTVFIEYLKTSKFNYKDLLFVLSVGGGNKEKNVSTAIIKAIDYANLQNSHVCGIVGRSDGYTALKADTVVVVPCVNNLRITPHAEEFQTVIWHCIVSHPNLQIQKTKW